jgi:hypothetical protein
MKRLNDSRNQPNPFSGLDEPYDFLAIAKYHRDEFLNIKSTLADPWFMSLMDQYTKNVATDPVFGNLLDQCWDIGYESAWCGDIIKMATQIHSDGMQIRGFEW